MPGIHLKLSSSLDGKDDILHAGVSFRSATYSVLTILFFCPQRIKRYLTSHGIDEGLYYDPHARHGQALLTGSAGYQRIFEWLAIQ